jgi:putative methanogenesis marker protein 12
MFLGIDHGTSAIRFSCGGSEWKLPREAARDFTFTDIDRFCPLSRIEGIALTYSMGDNFSQIMPVSSLKNRGVISQKGAGEHIGGGTKVFDEIARSGLPAVAIPGIHRGTPTDIRFKVYSHQASPEKVGIAWHVSQDLGDDVVVADCSSNTVTLLVRDGRIFGAFDACLFAPGTRHGPIDLDGIRKIDSGLSSANDAFLHAGVHCTMPPAEHERTVAMFAAMECASMLLLAPDAAVAVAGSLGPVIAREMEDLLGREVHVYDEWCAARGLAGIAKAVFSGARSILGIGVQP